MSWIRVLDPRNAEGLLKRLIAPFYDPETNRVDHILMVHSLDPEGLRAHLALYNHVMTGDDSLPRAEREMIAVTVSRLNRCHY